MKQNRDALSLSLLLMMAVVLLAGIIVLWQLPTPDSQYDVVRGDAILRVYGLDPEAGTEAFVLPPDATDARTGVRTVAATLSAETFGGLPIHVLGIETIDGDTRAYVDLTEPQRQLGEETWLGTYFQGSALASRTKQALLWTLLQPQYSGPWIDSLTFYYQGKPFEPLDHIDLGQVFTRHELIASGPPGPQRNQRDR